MVVRIRSIEPSAKNLQPSVTFRSFGVLDAYRAASRGQGYDFARALSLQMIEKQPIEFDGKIVLDIACGQRNIFFAHRMNWAARIIGIDIDAKSIRQNDVIHEGVVGRLACNSFG